MSTGGATALNQLVNIQTPWLPALRLVAADQHWYQFVVTETRSTRNIGQLTAWPTFTHAKSTRRTCLDLGLLHTRLQKNINYLLHGETQYISGPSKVSSEGCIIVHKLLGLFICLEKAINIDQWLVMAIIWSIDWYVLILIMIKWSFSIQMIDHQLVELARQGPGCLWVGWWVSAFWWWSTRGDLWPSQGPRYQLRNAPYAAWDVILGTGEATGVSTGV